MLRNRNITTNWDDVPVIFDLALAARLMGVTAEYLQKQAKLGLFPAHKIARVWRVDKDEFREYLKNQ